MKTKKYVLILILLAFLTLPGSSFGQNYGRVTPQTSDFMKYGEIPVSLFTGKMNIEIPLYRIKDLDFDIPISLLYTADGFKPEKRSDFVGLDWTLIAGGCITREIYGAPDDYYAKTSNEETGFRWVLEDVRFQQKDDIFNMTSQLINKSIGGYYLKGSLSTGTLSDYQPDLFMFNFNGHTGQFMINNKAEGQADHPGFKVDISGLTKQKSGIGKFEPDSVSTLRITTPDGYCYEFGGNVKAIEYSISFIDQNDISLELTNPTILAWYLSKITAPNGRTITFNYTQAPVNHPINPIWQAGRGRYTAASVSPIYVTTVKKAVLESIEVDNVKVEFFKSIEPLGTWNNEGFFLNQRTFNHAAYQLDSVTVKYNNEKRYSYKLEYEHKNKLRFLSAATLSDGGKYSFVYNHPVTYPTVGVLNYNMSHGQERDDYGYWNNNNNNCSYGLMEKIIYPTKGYSLFSYERHQFNQAVELKNNLKRILEASSMQYENGEYKLYGARIKTVTNYSTTSVVEMKNEYIYSTSINGGSSSGILYQARPYFIYNNQKNYVDGDWNKNYNIEESPIGYSCVIKKNLDGSYIRYRFSDYTNNPDTDDNTYHEPLILPTDNAFFIYMASLSTNRVSSNSKKRGLLLEKLFFNSQSVQKSQEKNLYKNISIGIVSPYEASLICDCDISAIKPPDNSYIVSFKGFGVGAIIGGLSRKIYLKTHPQVHQIINTDDIVSEESYSYNQYDQLRSKSIVINQTDTLRTNYTYPTECSENYCLILTSQHRLSPVIDQTTYRTSSIASQKEVERIHTDYKYVSSSNNLMVPNTIQSMFSGSGQWRTNITYNQYYKKGNVLQQTALDEVPVTFLWSYNYQYPIAKIENATSTQVKLALNYNDTDIENLAANTNPNVLSIGSSLRTNLPNALVTTYTYKPLVGMEKMTDPRGVVTTYDYDSFGRLKSIIKDGKTIETYDYKYKN